MVLFAGQLSQVKGPHLLIQAMTRLREMVQRPVRLLIAGNSMLWQKAGKQPVASAFEQTLRNADPALVCFTGALPQDEMPAVYAACDVFALPSIWFEPSPVTIREALASSRPVVASRIGGIPELVEDRETGLLVTPGDVAALAEALAACADDPTRCREMGELGGTRAARYAWTLAADHVFDIYDRLGADSQACTPDTATNG